MQKFLFPPTMTREEAMKKLRAIIDELGYTMVEVEEDRVYGASYRFSTDDADRFVQEFFPGLDPLKARLGNPTLDLSPKFLLVLPGHRLSWQYHNRRAEIGRFLTDGAYYKSSDDTQGERIPVKDGDIIQFQQGERHRWCSADDSYTVIAEIWQHMDPEHPSDEADIVRLQDDHNRQLGSLA